LGIYIELGDRASQADVHHGLAVTLQDQGRNTDALGHSRRALELFTAIGDRPGQALALNSVGWIHAKLGNHRQALSYCGQALDLPRGLLSPQHDPGPGHAPGSPPPPLGPPAGAAVGSRPPPALSRGAGTRRGQDETLDHIGNARHAAGQPDEARAAWEEALAI